MEDSSKQIENIPKDWEVVRLGDLIEFVKGKKPEEMGENFKDGYVPYLSTEYLRNNGKTKFVKPSDNTISVNDGDLILLWDGSNAGEFFIGKNGVLSSTMVKIQPKKDIYQVFLFYLLKTKENYLSGLTRGTGIPHVDKNVLETLKIPLPPLPEQRRIAEVLGTVDSAIQKVGGAIGKTERLKKGLMHRLLTRGIGHERFKESEVGRVPEEWEVKRLEDVADLESGGTPSRQVSEYWNGTIPWVKSGEFNDGIIHSTEEKITESGLRNSSAKIFLKGTLLMALYGRGTVSKTAILGLDAATNQAIGAIISINSSFDAKFMQYYLIFSRSKLLGQVVNPSTDVGRTNIYLGSLKLFKIPLPPLSEQRRIAGILSAVDKKLELERKRTEKLERVKKGLMNELLTGRKRLKV